MCNIILTCEVYRTRYQSGTLRLFLHTWIQGEWANHCQKFRCLPSAIFMMATLLDESHSEIGYMIAHLMHFSWLWHRWCLWGASLVGQGTQWEKKPYRNRKTLRQVLFCARKSVWWRLAVCQTPAFASSVVWTQSFAWCPSLRSVITMPQSIEALENREINEDCWAAEIGKMNLLVRRKTSGMSALSSIFYSRLIVLADRNAKCIQIVECSILVQLAALKNAAVRFGESGLKFQNYLKLILFFGQTNENCYAFS